MRCPNTPLLFVLDLGFYLLRLLKFMLVLSLYAGKAECRAYLTHKKSTFYRPSNPFRLCLLLPLAISFRRPCMRTKPLVRLVTLCQPVISLLNWMSHKSQSRPFNWYFEEKSLCWTLHWSLAARTKPCIS